MSPLAAKVMKRFSTIPPYPRENDFLGPYNKLLHTVFPCRLGPDYTVIPQLYSFLDSYGSANTIIGFEVVLEDNPVFFLQIKKPKSLTVLSAREKADDQMRKCMRPLIALSICPKVSAHSACIFRSTATIHKPIPERVLPDRERETDFAPSSCWDCDILEDEGGRRFQDIVAEIKAKCDEL